MMLSIGYGYFYTVSQGEQLYLKAALQRNYAQVQASEEKLNVTGIAIGPALGFIVDNQGIHTTITAYFVTNESNDQVVQYNSGSGSTPELPYTIGQGQSVSFDTGVVFKYGQSYVIKVITARGTTATALYPPIQLSVQAINSQLAAGIGSIALNFSSFVFYAYTNVNDPYVLNLAQPYSASYIPYATPIAFSVQITNNDPNQGTITINSHSDLFIYQQCTTGCGQQPLIVFYAVNVAKNGTITSTSQGSYVSTIIPFGASKIIYFASTTDLALGAFSPLQVSGKHSYGLGENDVFLIITGTNTYSTDAVLHAQNIPFAASYVGQNIGFFSETGVTCAQSSPTNFYLTITNSQWSLGNIEQVTINATSFSPSASGTAYPTWKVSGSGTITWSATNSQKYLTPGKSWTYEWSGTTSSTVGAQLIFPITITWDSKTPTVQQSAVGCFVT